MTDYSAIAKTLSDSLQLSVAPIAVCLTDEAPQAFPDRRSRPPPGACFGNAVRRAPS